MARKKTTTIRMHLKAEIASRLREIRQELFGEHGGPELARRLGLPARTWYNYETGVTVPAEVLLGFIEQTGVSPIWLLTGNGPKHRDSLRDMVLGELTPADLIRRGLEKLESAPVATRPMGEAAKTVENAGEFVAVNLITMEQLGQDRLFEPTESHVLAYQRWIPHPSETVAVQLVDDAMYPILPAGSVVAIDRAARDPDRLQGRMVAARVGDQAVIRWMEKSGRHAILRPNHGGKEYPPIPLALGEGGGADLILGQVVWSWSRFAQP